MCKRKVLPMSFMSSTVMYFSCLLFYIFSFLVAGCSEPGGDTPSTTELTSPTVDFGSPSGGQPPFSPPAGSTDEGGGEGRVDAEPDGGVKGGATSDVSLLDVAEPDAESEWVDVGQASAADEQPSDGDVSEAPLEEIESVDVAIGVDDSRDHFA